MSGSITLTLSAPQAASFVVGTVTYIKGVGNQYTASGFSFLDSTFPYNILTVDSASGSFEFNLYYFNSKCSLLTSINLSGATITTIPQHCFASSCPLLTTIAWPQGLINIGTGPGQGSTFDGCDLLLNIIVPNTVQNIYEYAFQPNNITPSNYLNITINSNVTFIQNAPFNNQIPNYDPGHVILHTDSLTSAAAIYFSSTYPNVLIETPPPVCFKEGTKILCLKDDVEQYIEIEKLRKGDLVKTLKHEYVSINLIGYSEIYNSGDDERIENRLYKCSKSEYPELNEDLIITGCHSILINHITPEQVDKTIKMLDRIYITDGKYRLMACIDDRAETYKEKGRFTVWHLALDNTDYYMNYGIYANGLLVETTSIRFLNEMSRMILVK